MKNLINERGSMQAIARAMSRNYGVQLIPSGYECCTDGQVIKYPFNADYLDGASRSVLHGLLDHESAHVAEEREHADVGQQTPMQVMRACTDRKERMLLNVFEDIRIELKYGKRFPGVAENLNAANVNSVDLFKKRHGDSGEKAARSNFWHTLGSAIIMKARGYSITWLPEGFIPFIEAVEQEIVDSRKEGWARDSLALAKRVIAKIGEEADKLQEEQRQREEQKQAAKEKAEAGKESDGENDEGAEGEEGEGEGADGEGADEGEGEEGEGEGKTETDEDAQGSTSESWSGSEDGKGAEGAEEGKPAAEEGKGEGCSSLTDEALDQACDFAKGVEGDAEQTDLIKFAKDQIMDLAKDDGVSNRRWVPHPEAQRRDRETTPSGNLPAYEKAKATVAAQIRGLKGKLLNVIRSKAPAHMEGDRRRGELDSSRLATVRMGNRNVFQVEVEGEKLDTAVSVLIDLSGSMGDGNSEGQKAYYAKLMAIALAETFDALGLPFEVIGFHTLTTVTSASAGYTRVCPMEYHIFKSFDDSFKRVKARLSSITGMMDNIDGEAVLYTARRLAARSESRKILMVLSDGMPACTGSDYGDLNNHLLEAIKTVTKSGIEVIGIGAMSDHVNKFYSKAQGASGVVINNIDQLPVDVYRLMRERLLGRKGRAA